MIEKLVQYINDKISRELSDSEIELLSEVFQLKKIRKHQYFLQAGEPCKVAGFLLKGAMKKYMIDDQGRENILELFIENWWPGDRESFMVGTPSPYFIDAIENSELLVISKEDFLAKVSKQPFFTELSSILTERQSYQLMKRLHVTKTLSAEEKLEALQSTHPEFLMRFPQHIIASYLGMTKETLSRIRSNQARK